MKIIYEKEKIEDISVEKPVIVDGKETGEIETITEKMKSYEEVEKKDATHKHTCRHEEGLPCKREAI